MSNKVIKERPISFSTEMVRAISDGQKTMTRRFVKGLTVEENKFNPAKINFSFIKGKNHASGVNLDIKDLSCSFLGIGSFCPYGKVGDILYVKETFQIIPPNLVFYRADENNSTKKGWKSSRFMPKAAARIWLEITDRRVERLHDIPEEDILAEGVRIPVQDGSVVYEVSENKALSFLNEQEPDNATVLKAFWAELWTKIYSPDSWDQNPYVWCNSFSVLSLNGR